MTDEEIDKIDEAGFIKGVAFAAGFLARSHREDGLAVEVIEQCNIDLDKFSAASEYDLEAVRQWLPELPTGHDA